MNKFFATLLLIITILILPSCANIEMGFDEDSIFYTKPIEKEKEPLLSSKELKQVQTENKENETTFSYDREDGE